jgi:hypothetical protein
MNKSRLILLLAAALLTLAVALYVATQRNHASDANGGAVLPALANELNSVTAVSVLKGSATPTVTLHKQGEQWTVEQRANYPADLPKLRKLLLSLSEAKIREQKTSIPANFAAIGVQDPALPGATGLQVTLVAQDGKHALIIGKAVGEGSFVRRAGENASYIVEPAISVEAEPRFWIDTKLLDLAASNIQSISVKPAAGPAYSLHRMPAVANGGFVLDAVPSGRLAADAQTLAPSPTSFSGLSAEDVAAAGDIDFAMPSIATLGMSDGNIITFTGSAVGDKRWIEVAASKDAALTAKTAGRAFQIAAYRYDAIFRPLEQLLVPKPEKTPAAKPPGAAPKRPAPATRP